jgi:hypothetical protein
MGFFKLKPSNSKKALHAKEVFLAESLEHVSAQDVLELGKRAIAVDVHIPPDIAKKPQPMAERESIKT